MKHLAFIICDIPTHKNHILTIAALYRQWSLPRDINTMDSQTDRYKNILDICTSILNNTSYDFIMISDDNIGTLNDNNFHENYTNHEKRI